MRSDHHRALVEPVDPLLFGDNRSARAGQDHLLRDQDLSPLTLHGALGQWLVDRSGGWPGELLGQRVDDILEADPERTAALLGWCFVDVEGRRWFPRPRHLRIEARRPRGFLPLEVLVPRRVPGAETTLGDVLLAHDVERKEYEGDVLISEDALGELLTGVAPATLRHRVRRTSEVFRPEPRPGIQLTPEGRVAEGRFFTRPYRRVRPRPAGGSGSRCGEALEAWLSLVGSLEAPARGIGHLGGDQRRVRVEATRVAEPPLAALREQVAEAAASEETEGFFVYALTPRLVDGVRAVFAGCTPVAAAIGPARTISGWNTRLHQPRPLVAVEPEGSVYFYRWPDGVRFVVGDRAGFVREHWLEAFATRGAAAGFGRVMIGVWR